MTRLILVATALLLLPSCVTEQSIVAREAVLAKGADAYDAGLENAETYICRIASVGSVMRRYGRSQETADVWRELCEGQRGVDLIAPSE